MTYSGKATYSSDDLEISLGTFDYIVDVDAKASYYHDDGCMYLRNGDPGYPPEDDFDIEEVNVNSVKYEDEDGNMVEVTDEAILKQVEDKVWDYLSDHEDYFISNEE